MGASLAVRSRREDFIANRRVTSDNLFLSMTPNPYEAPACQRVKHSLREASSLVHGSSDSDPRCCARLA